MGKRIQNAASSAWRRFQILDRQVARTASRYAETSLDERRAMKSAPDYATVKAFADSGARAAGF